MRWLLGDGPIWRGGIMNATRSGSPPTIPTITVTSGTITPFSRGGVNYVEILFQQSGSFTVSADVPWHNRALAGGGATGGRSQSTIYIPGSGGAGGLIRSLGSALAAGSYSVTIGAGGAAITSGVARNNGNNSTLSRPDGQTDTAIGGGAGGLYNAGMVDGGNGGSGGSGRARSDAVVSSVAGAGTDGQGYAGGTGYSTTTSAEAASGGSGGSGSAGGSASAGAPGSAGAGTLLDWIATPRTVCSGQAGLLLATAQVASQGQVYGSGSQGAINADVGKGGDGFLFLVVRADQGDVRMAA